VVLTVCNAGKPCVPQTHLDAGVLDWGGAEVTKGISGMLALALHCQFLVHGDMLERVEVFKYLGCLLAQDDNDAQAIRQ
jgi:hypothetical protein